jgi:hypothetical protein
MSLLLTIVPSQGLQPHFPGMVPVEVKEEDEAGCRGFFAMAHGHLPGIPRKAANQRRSPACRRDHDVIDEVIDEKDAIEEGTIAPRSGSAP